MAVVRPSNPASVNELSGTRSIRAVVRPASPAASANRLPFRPAPTMARSNRSLSIDHKWQLPVGAATAGARQSPENGAFRAIGTHLAAVRSKLGLRPVEDGCNENGHGDFQAFQARRGAGRADVARHPGPDGERSERLRPAEGSDRDLSRCGGRGELPA